MSKEKPTGLFDKLYDASKEVKKAIKKPGKIRKLKRALESAYDDALKQRDEAIDSMDTEREKLEEMDINTVIKLKATAKKASETMELIKDEYFVQFGEYATVMKEES